MLLEVLEVFAFSVEWPLLIVSLLAALGLHCCIRAFSSCGEWELISSCSARASHCGFSCFRAQALGCEGFILAYGLSNCSSRAPECSSVAVALGQSCVSVCWVFLNHRTVDLCIAKVDSEPLDPTRKAHAYCVLCLSYSFPTVSSLTSRL